MSKKETQSSQNSLQEWGSPKARNVSQLWRISWGSKELQLHAQLPSRWVLPWEDDPPWYLALEISDQENRGAVGSQDPALEGPHTNTLAPSSSAKAAAWKAPRSYAESATHFNTCWRSRDWVERSLGSKALAGPFFPTSDRKLHSGKK